MKIQATPKPICFICEDTPKVLYPVVWGKYGGEILVCKECLTRLEKGVKN